MGQSLSEPKTEKETVDYDSGDYMVAVSGMQGWRPEMEDAWSVQLPLSTADASSAYFAVFDGHGSRHFSHHCGCNLHQVILDNPDFCKGDYGVGLKGSFHSLDLAMKQGVDSSHLHGEFGGTTAVVVLVKDSCIYCANVGDSRAIASKRGRVVELSRDHKPSLPVEVNRIYRAGGWVEFNRVNGNLALSRALGDFEFKQNKDLSAEEQIVTADPDVVSFPLCSDHEFLVLACDGVWDVMTNEEVLEFIRKRIAQKMKPAQICESLLDHCLAPDCRMGGVGCDNMTVILTCFLHGATYAELAERCAQVAVRSEETQLEESFLNNQHCLSSQSKETVLRTAYHHNEDPLDLRGTKTGPGMVMHELQFDGNSSDSHSDSESQQRSCTV